MKNKYFEGWYLKHQKGNDTIAFIPGLSNDTAFIQVITNGNSYNALYSSNKYKLNEGIQIGNNIFSKRGIKIDMRDKGIDIFGIIRYSGLTPIKYDIMGVFKYLPMECRHGIISMHHELDGLLHVDGNIINLSNGVGYIEKDSGTSFPKSYLWIQCNDFNEKCSIIVSIADIPFLGFSFKGCICVVYYKGREYRLATYLGIKIKHYNAKKVTLEQGAYCLEIDIINDNSQRLYAPDHGSMTRIIHECASCEARFRFFVKGKLLFDMKSGHASYELV